MEWALCLGHGIVGALLLPFAFADAGTRRRAIETASVLGVILGIALVVAGEAGAEWRTTGFESPTATPAGLAAAAAWIVTGALAHRGPRVDHVALTGVAASGLALAATGRYVVPALVFWLCSSAALAARVRTRWAWVVLAVSDSGLGAAAFLQVWGENTWTFDVAAGPAVVALAAAAVVRGGAHVVAPWPGLMTAAGGAAAPLLAGGAVALAARASTSEPWVAVALLAAALATAVIALVRDAVGPEVLATWVTTLALAACFVSPSHAPLAGAAAVTAVAAAALWPYTAGRGGVARALLVSAVPLTAGFGMVAGAGADAFAQAADGGGSIAWTVVAALFPVVAGAGVVLGGRAARTDASELVPEAVLATWLLLGTTVAIGVLPGAVGDAGVLGDSAGTIALQLIALAAGAVAGVAARRAGTFVEPSYRSIALAGPAPIPDLPRAAAWSVLALALATAVATGWLTVAGLRVGFL